MSSMSIDSIIKSVRWCIDEESNNNSSLKDATDDKDDTYMDNIIKDKINDALHWLCVTASSSAGLAEGITIPTETKEMEIKVYDEEWKIGVITLPTNIDVFNIARIRVDGWYKAVVPTEDTDDEALYMWDLCSTGTKDRPQAAVMRETPLKVLVQPMGEKASISYVGVQKSISDTDTSVDVPDMLKNSFIYYIAYLLLTAFNDSNAAAMYNIALQQLGVNSSQSDS